MQGSQKVKTHVSLKSESVWFKTKLVSQFLTLSLLLTQPFYLSYLHAAPIGGEVVDGLGTISQTDLTTTINQTTQNLAIDWQSFDVDTNERVQFIQPDTTSIVLNRILGNNGSTIQGQIDANGQVILVNPNGIFFTSTATINVGGLVASSLDMTPSDFMNGNYVFNEVLGTDGAVINSGIINASVGGNVALIGKQVKNDGLISANLGSVILAAGKQSILTFDNQGLIGVQVTKEVLQDEIGLEEAVINSGDINAAGGRVLLTASTSQDVFSQAVNIGVLEQATSVVVNDDGTFTLGAGADVLNSGSIDVSTDVNTDNTARIVLLGENITSSGQISADVIDGQAGEIELHATDEMLLTENSITSAQAFLSGQGGLIKVLGDKVGLFDSSQVNASGTNGGGQVLIGGDQQGLNTLIRNANFIYLGENTSVNADATLNGDGGKIITFASDTARIHASLFARGGVNGGNGGFIETSGLKGFEISKAPDVSAVNGDGGLWLIDPNNIRIINDTVATDTEQTSNITTTSPFETSNDGAILEVGLIETALSGGDVLIETTSSGADTDLGNISFEANLDFNSAGNADRTLTLKAHNDVSFTSASSITDSDRSNGGTDPQFDLDIEADSDRNGLGNVNISTNATGINLFGGTLDIVNAQDVNFNAGFINTFNSGATSSGGNLVVSQAGAVNFNGSSINTAGGDVDIQNSTSVAFNGGAISTNGGEFSISTSGNVTSTSAATNSIFTTGGNFVVDDAIDFDSSYVDIDVGSGDINLDGGGTGVTGNVVLGNLTASGFTSSNLFITKATNITQATNTSISISNITDLDVTSGTGLHTIVLENSGNDFGEIKLQASEAKINDSNNIVLIGGTNITSLLKVVAAGNIVGSGNVTVSNINNDALAIFDAIKITQPYGDVILNNNNNFNNVKIVNANDVTLIDVDGGIAFEANNDAGTGGVLGNLIITSTGAGNITDMGSISIAGTDYTGEINVGGTSSFSVGSGQSIYLDSTNNTFTGNVSFLGFNTGSPIIANIAIVDDDTTGLTLSDVAVTGDLKITAGAIVFQDTHANNLEATTNIAGATGNISQLDHLVITNSTTLDAVGDITLNDSNNDFQSITIMNGETVSLRDDNAISILSSNTNNDLTIRADSTISLVGDITTNTNSSSSTADVTFTGNVVLDTSTNGETVTIDTSASDGNVSFSGNIDNVDVVAPRNNLSIKTGNGDVTVVGNIGSAQSIGSLIINKDITSTTSIVSVNQINTSNTLAANATSAVDITADLIKLGGDIDTDVGTEAHARGVTLQGDVLLTSNVDIDTSDSLSDGSVTISGSINSDSTNRQLTIRSDTGAVNLNGAIGDVSALSKLEIDIDATSTTGGIVNLSSVNTEGDNGNVINVKGTTITLNGDLTSNDDSKGGDILLTGNVELNQDITITSDTLSSTGNDGDVTITGNINSDDVLTPRALVINADDNNISVGNAGDIVALQKIELITESGSSGTTIDVGSITTTDADAIQNTTTVNTGVVLTAETINLGGNITSNTIVGAGTESGSVTVNGAAVLGANVTVDTYLAGTTTGGDVTFSSTIDADDAANDRDFSINAGNAIATITGIVGATDAVNSFSVTSASTTNINEINTQTGGIDITSGIINLNGNLNTKALDDAGHITLVGAVNLNSDTTFDTEGVTSDAAIFIDGSVNNATSRALILNAGSADVTMTGTAGTGSALASLNIIGENVDIGHVTSTGNIDITGNLGIDLFGDLTSNAGFIDFQNGAVTLNDNVTLTVAGSNAVTVDGTINADDAVNDHSFTVNAGSGNVTLNGDIGLIQAIQGLAISTTGTVRIQNVNTRSDGVVISSNILNLSGSLDTTNDAAAAGEVKLTQDNLNLLANININTNSATGIDGNISIFDPLPPTGMFGNDNSFDLDAGDGIVNITTNLTDLFSFSVTNSLTTTLNGVTTNNGAITVNADGDIALNGNYDSGAADISFNADVDSNGSGLLSLNNTSVFSGNNITFSSYTLNTNAMSVTAVDTVTFNNTLGSIAIGDDYLFAQSILNNAFLDKVNANTLQVSSDNSFVMLSGADLSDNSYSLDLDARYIYAYAVDSQLNDLNATATDSIYLYKNITASNDISFNAPVIYSYNNTPSTEITSTSGNIDITGDIAGYAALNLNAVAGSVSILGNTNVTLSNNLLLNANVVNHDNIVATNNINIISGGGYTQTGSLESTNGNISIVANSGNINLDYNKTDTGTITVNAVNGAITDNNGNATNIETAGVIDLHAVNGIGHNDPLEIISLGQNTNISAENIGSGNIEISNTGTILLDNILNIRAGNEFYIQNDGTVTVNSVVLDKTSDLSIATFDVINGDVLGVQGNTKHLTANTAIFNMNNTGIVGAPGASFITDVPNKIEVVSSLGTNYIEYYGQVPPVTFIGDNDYKNRALQVIESLSGQQLIELESLAEIDPAIFTDVRNYSSSDIALMMPSDQRYTEDEEEDEEEKLKRQKYINTVN